MNKNFENCYRAAHNAGREMASMAAMEGGKLEGNLPGAMAMALAPTAGALHVVALAMAGPEAGEEGWKPSADQMLFAALFTVAVAGTGNGLEFHPPAFLEAFDMFEKVIGKKPDGFLLKPFADAVRSFEKDGDKPLAAFMEARHKGTTH